MVSLGSFTILQLPQPVFFFILKIWPSLLNKVVWYCEKLTFLQNQILGFKFFYSDPAWVYLKKSVKLWIYNYYVPKL